MAFLSNKVVNLFTLHYSFQALAQGSGGVFLLVFLLHAGLTVPQTLLALAATVTVRLASRVAVLPFAKRFGLKRTLILGCLIVALQYPLSAAIRGLDWALAARCLASGVGEAFYWSAYHAYFASVGDSEHRGHQISAREAFAAAIGIVAPLLGAWSLQALGAPLAFSFIGTIQAASAIPLLAAPDVAIRQTAPGAFRAARLGVLLYIANGWFAATFVLIWQIALFVSLGESLSAYGGTMALAAVAGTAGALLLGKGIDAGYGSRAVAIVFTALIAAAAARAASLGMPGIANAANALGTFVICFYVPTIMTAVYNLSKSSPCSLRFHIATESAWDLGCCAGALIAAIMAIMGISLSWAVALTIPAALAQMILLRPYYLGNKGTD